jgi:DNA-binding transcriptional MerR regulator
VRYRVDELAARSRLSVDTVRFYQTKGLLGSPEREGRVAWYSDVHLERLAKIKELKEKGFTLEFIGRLLDHGLDPADEALIAAVAGAVPQGESEEGRRLSLEELAARTDVSPALLQALEREGLLVPSASDGESLFTESDVSAVRAGLELLEAGLPLSELLDLGRRHSKAMTETAERAVEVFVTFIRDPIRASADSEADAARRMVEAFRKMLEATTTLVSHHFRRQLLAVAQARIEREGLDSDFVPTTEPSSEER